MKGCIQRICPLRRGPIQRCAASMSTASDAPRACGRVGAAEEAAAAEEGEAAAAAAQGQGGGWRRGPTVAGCSRCGGLSSEAISAESLPAVCRVPCSTTSRANGLGSKALVTMVVGGLEGEGGGDVRGARRRRRRCLSDGAAAVGGIRRPQAVVHAAKAGRGGRRARGCGSPRGPQARQRRAMLTRRGGWAWLDQKKGQWYDSKMYACQSS